MTLYAYALPQRMMARRLASVGRRFDQPQLRLNIVDQGEDFVLTAPVPGLKAEDIRIRVLEDVVHIEGGVPVDETDYLVREFATGPFERELRMPSALDAEKVEAKIIDGMLTLRLPKAESAKPKTIKVAAK
jgi:HSP20 family protein